MKCSDIPTKEESQRRDLFVFILSTMRVAGMYPFRMGNQSSCLNFLLIVLNWIYEIFNYFVCMHIAILFIYTIYIYYGQGDLEFLVNCLIQTVIYLWTITMKLYFRRFRHKLLNEIISSVNEKHQIRSAYGFTYVTVTEALRQSNLWIKSYVYCCYVGTIFWLMLPIVYRDRSLPLACWYPFNYSVSRNEVKKRSSCILFCYFWQQPIVYELVFFLQAVGQIQVAAAFASSSGFHMVLGIVISGQYDMLSCSLKNILATSYLKMGANMAELRLFPSY